jgi:hypothetical protein
MSNPDLNKLLADEAAKVAAMTEEERRKYLDQIVAVQRANVKPYTGGERQAQAMRPEYRYIGRDGQPVLARDLEDQRDALQAKLDKAMDTLRLADDALTEAKAILGGEYGDYYGPLCETMLELRAALAALQTEGGV